MCPSDAIMAGSSKSGLVIDQGKVEKRETGKGKRETEERETGKGQ
jgi:hypothetical protein